MRNRSFATLGLLALLAASAFGQQVQKLVADIPFEFHYGNAVMPAGHYEVDLTAINVRGLVSVECYTCQVRAAALTNNVGGGPNAPTEGRLVFNKYGDTFFLAQVWAPGSVHGSALNKSKTEREISRTTPDVARFTLPVGTSHVMIARR